MEKVVNDQGGRIGQIEKPLEVCEKICQCFIGAGIGIGVEKAADSSFDTDSDSATSTENAPKG